MRNGFLLIILLTCCCGIIGLLEATEVIEATTQDGRKVLLKLDGSWEFAESAPPGDNIPAVGRETPSSSTESLRSRHGFIDHFFDPSIWSAQPAPGSPAEYLFHHVDGDVYAMIIVERLSIPLPVLKRAALGNAEATGCDPQVLEEESRVVNGQNVLSMRFSCAVQGIPFMYHGYYWSGDQGAAQVLTYTGANLYKEYRHDIEDLLDGLTVVESPKPDDVSEHQEPEASRRQ